MSDANGNLSVEAVNARFDRIESKIDKLSDAMISLARAEEKMVAMEIDRKNTGERLNRHSEMLDKHTAAIAEHGRDIAENTRVVNNITRLVWIIISAIVVASVGAAVAIVFGLPGI